MSGLCDRVADVILPAYDMANEAIEVLRRHDLVTHTNVDVDSVRFRIDLPLTVSVDNPVVGATQVADAILAG